MTCQWGGLVRLCDKLNTLYLYLQKTHGDVLWEAPTIETTRSFDLVTNVRSRGNLKNLYLYFHEKSVSLLSLWPPNLTGCWFWGEGPARKRFSPHQLFVYDITKLKNISRANVKNIFSRNSLFPSIVIEWTNLEKKVILRVSLYLTSICK